MLYYVLPLVPDTARNDNFEIINYSNHRQAPRNDNDGRNSFAAKHSVCGVVRHGAAIVSNDNSFLRRCPGEQIRVRGFAKTDLIGGDSIEVGNAAQEPAKDNLVEIVIDEQP